jgi:hypothetical protein
MIPVAERKRQYNRRAERESWAPEVQRESGLTRYRTIEDFSKSMKRRGYINLHIEPRKDNENHFRVTGINAEGDRLSLGYVCDSDKCNNTIILGPPREKEIRETSWDRYSSLLRIDYYCRGCQIKVKEL